jgi:hypothetical protein
MPCRDTVSRLPVLAVDILVPASVRDSGDPVLVRWSSSSRSKQSPHMPPRTRKVITATNPTAPSVTTIPASIHRTGVTWGNTGNEVATATSHCFSIQLHKMCLLQTYMSPWCHKVQGRPLFGNGSGGIFPIFFKDVTSVHHCDQSFHRREDIIMSDSAMKNGQEYKKHNNFRTLSQTQTRKCKVCTKHNIRK